MTTKTSGRNVAAELAYLTRTLKAPSLAAAVYRLAERARAESSLAERGQRVLYIPGRIVHQAAATYRGDGKTDAKDARIIADQARMRTDLQPVRSCDQISTDLRLLTARRTDLVYDRVRAINRLRATMLEYFPALEAAFDYSKKGPN